MVVVYKHLYRIRKIPKCAVLICSKIQCVCIVNNVLFLRTIKCCSFDTVMKFASWITLVCSTIKLMYFNVCSVLFPFIMGFYFAISVMYCFWGYCYYLLLLSNYFYIDFYLMCKLFNYRITLLIDWRRHNLDIGKIIYN